MYFLNEIQLAEFYRFYDTDVKQTLVDQNQLLIKSKIQYLTRLQEQPLNANSLILKQIIDDYIKVLLRK